MQRFYFPPRQDGNGTGQLGGGGGEERVSEYSGYSSVISGDLNLDILPLEQGIQGDQPAQGPAHLQVTGARHLSVLGNMLCAGPLQHGGDPGLLPGARPAAGLRHPGGHGAAAAGGGAGGGGGGGGPGAGQRGEQLLLPRPHGALLPAQHQHGHPGQQPLLLHRVHCAAPVSCNACCIY